MKKDKREKGIEKFSFIFLSLTVLAFSLIMGCSNPANDDSMPGLQADAPGGKGYFSLTVEGAGQAKTVLPAAVGSFTSYNLNFEDTVPPNNVTTITITNTTNPVLVDAGTYNLVVEGLVSGQVVARGSPASPVTINPGANTDVSVTLDLIADGVADGTFSWEISFTTSPTITAANMTITPRSGGTTPPLIDLTVPANLTGTQALKSGYYNVLFTVVSTDNKIIEWREILHVYQNLVSPLTKNFTDDYFNNNVYNVTWVYNDAAISTETTNSVIHGSAVTYPSPTRTGYTLDDWYTDNNTFNNAWVSTAHPVKDIKLYARWKSTVTYNPNNGGSNTTADAYGGVTMANVTVPGQGSLALSGFTFDDWNLNNDGSSTTHYAAGASFPPEGNTTLYARWKYTISFDGNGSDGGTVPSPVAGYANGNITLPNNTLTKSGSSYDGWYSNPAGTGGAGYAAGSSPAVNIISGVLGTTPTLYAKWNLDPVYEIELAASGLNSGAYDFGDQVMGYGAQTALTVTVNNTGNQATGLLTVGLSGTNAGDFTLSTTSITSIAVSGNATFTVVPKTGIAVVDILTATVTVSGSNSISDSFTVSFEVTDPNAGMDGSSTYPWKVYDPATLLQVGSGSNGWNSNSNYLQIADIDMDGVTFTGLGPDFSTLFKGIYDGGGHTITKLTNIGPYHVGMFNYIGGIGTVIKNLGLIDVKMQSTDTTTTRYVGGLVGNIYSANVNIDVLIENCFVSGSVSSDHPLNARVGGLVGNLAADTTIIIRNCYSTANVKAIGTNNSHAGGLVGDTIAILGNSLKNCYFAGTVENRQSIIGGSGGLFGTIGYQASGAQSWFVIDQCVTLGELKLDSGSQASYYGRAVGWIDGTSNYSGGYTNLYSNMTTDPSGLPFTPTGTLTNKNGFNFVDWDQCVGWDSLPNTKTGANESSPWWWDGTGNPKLWFED